jgi:hypothetical protein
MTTAIEGVRGQLHVSAALYPRERPGTHCTEGWVAPGLVWTGAENFPPPGFDPRTVQPVASRYTDYATQPFCSWYMPNIISFTLTNIEGNGSSCKVYELFAKGPGCISSGTAVKPRGFVIFLRSYRKLRDSNLIKDRLLQNSSKFIIHQSFRQSTLHSLKIENK